MCARFADGWASFLVRDTVMQDLPHQPTQSVGNRANRLGVAEPSDHSSVDEFEDAALGLHGRVRLD
jgi:hypothetical protein